MLSNFRNINVIISIIITSFLLFGIGTATANTAGNKPRAIFYTIKPDFQVNLKTKGKIRFMQVEVQVMTRNAEVVTAIENLLPMIRHELLVLFSSKTYTELRKQRGREKMRKEALKAIRNILEDEVGTPGIENLLFTRMVTQ